MAWPTDDLTTTSLDATNDDPSAARVELLAAIQKVQALIAAYNVASGVCPLDAGGQVPTANLGNATIADATTTAKGKVELATAAEVAALTDATRVVCPSTLPIATAVQKGLCELATDAESVGTSDSFVLTPGNLQYWLGTKAPWSVANGGTGSGSTPTASSSPQADNIKAVKQDQGHGNIGSLCFATRSTGLTTVAAGSTLAGSSLQPCGVEEVYNDTTGLPDSPYFAITGGSTLNGTWRCLGTHPATFAVNQGATLWQRIS